MSWDDLIVDSAQPVQREEKPVVREEKPKVQEVKVKNEKPKDDEKERLQKRIVELERTIQQQNQIYQQMHREISEKNNRIQELEQTAEHCNITTADKRNLQFLVNCVAKTYKIEFRKNRAPAVKLALVNIIERFELETPDEMESE